MVAWRGTQTFPRFANRCLCPTTPTPRRSNGSLSRRMRSLRSVAFLQRFRTRARQMFPMKYPQSLPAARRPGNFQGTQVNFLPSSGWCQKASGAMLPGILLPAMALTGACITLMPLSLNGASEAVLAGSDAPLRKATSCPTRSRSLRPPQTPLHPRLLSALRTTTRHPLRSRSMSLSLPCLTSPTTKGLPQRPLLIRRPVRSGKHLLQISQRFMGKTAFPSGSTSWRVATSKALALPFSFPTRLPRITSTTTSGRISCGCGASAPVLMPLCRLQQTLDPASEPRSLDSIHNTCLSILSLFSVLVVFLFIFFLFYLVRLVRSSPRYMYYR